MIIVSPAGESEDDPNTDSQHLALEPEEAATEYGDGGRSLRSISTGGGGGCS
jgi:hypothetical protein